MHSSDYEEKYSGVIYRDLNEVNEIKVTYINVLLCILIFIYHLVTEKYSSNL